MSEPLVNKKPSVWDESLQPWLEEGEREELTSSRSMSVALQWVIGLLIVVITAVWLSISGLLPQGRDRYGVPLVLFLLALAGFAGFVSPSVHRETPFVEPEECADNSEYVFTKVKHNFVSMYVFAAIFAYLKALLPFLIGTSAPVFFAIMVPVSWAHSKGLVMYSYKWYSTASPSVGLFNAVSFILTKYGIMPVKMRWLLPGLIVPFLLSFLADIVPLLSGGKSIEYKLNLAQSTRLLLYRMGFFMFMFYGICRNGEELIGVEMGLEIPQAMDRSGL